MPLTRIDRGHRTRLPLCSCGWRGQTTTSETSARRQCVDHEADVHPQSRRARDAAWKYAQRQRRQDTPTIRGMSTPLPDDHQRAEPAHESRRRARPDRPRRGPAHA